eukprot:COSAG06_NODE_14_length_35011_cov_20.984132_20_plen_134_part_00
MGRPPDRTAQWSAPLALPCEVASLVGSRWWEAAASPQRPRSRPSSALSKTGAALECVCFRDGIAPPNWHAEFPEGQVASMIAALARTFVGDCGGRGDHVSTAGDALDAIETSSATSKSSRLSSPMARLPMGAI